LTNKVITIATSLALVAAVFIAAGTALAQPPIPPFPAIYSGTVYVGGQPGGAGLLVSCSILDWNSEDEEGAGEGEPTDESGGYLFAVAPPEDKYVGETIHFYVNGAEADETDTFQAAGDVAGFDLHIDALPSPGPTSTSDNVTTPTPTQTTVSPTSTGQPPVPTGTQVPATPTATSPPPTQTPPPDEGGGPSWGAIAGIAIAAILLLAGMATLVVKNRAGGRGGRKPAKPKT
jgi:hypothetical protein